MPSYADLSLATPRLLLRPFRHADAADLLAVYEDPQVFRYIPIGGWKHIDEAHQRIARDINTMAAGEYIRLAVERREDSRVIGEVLLFKLDLASERAELGYALARSAWGCGYVREALQALIEHGFRDMGLNRIEALVDPRNTASCAVLEGLGFTNEGTSRERFIIRGERTDSRSYGLLRRDWDARAAR